MRSSRAKVIASIASVAVIAGAGSYGTFAAFTDTTSNTGNVFTAGDLGITDDDGATALFTVADARLGPGDSIPSRCIKVTNSGSLPFDSVALAPTVGGTAGGGTGDGLQDNLTVTVERGTGTASTGGASHDCTGFTADTTIYTGALSGWTATYTDTDGGWNSGDAKYYRISGSLPAGTPQDAEADTATISLTWTATS